MTLRLEGRLRLEQVDDLVLRVRQPVWKSISVSRRNAIEQAPRRWRGGRRDDSARTSKFSHRRQPRRRLGEAPRALVAARVGDARLVARDVLHEVRRERVLGRHF